MVQRFDVIIVGAGLNGLATGLALAGPRVRRPVKVAIIDAHDPYQKILNDGDARASAITLSSRRMFEAMGTWDQLAPHAQEMRQIIVTDGKTGAEGRPTLLQFGDTDSPNSTTAYMFENGRLLEGLLTGLKQSPHIELITGHGVAGQNFGPGLAKVTLSNGLQYSANLLVAADGGNSPLRKAAGIELVGWSYDQMGIVVSFAHQLPHHGRAEEHFTASGPFAILPLTGNRSSIVWAKETVEAKRLLALDVSEFEKALQMQVGQHLGKITLIGKPQGYPLSMFFAKAFHGARLALIGDAAHIIHPLAGLGLNLGLRDGAALAECVGDAYALGQDIGSLSVLERYTGWRRFDTVATAIAMDGMNRLFSNDNPLLRMLRDVGLQATNQVAALKNTFAREAAGQTGSLPKLLRGELN